MKKITFVFGLLLALFLFPIVVNAKDATFDFDCATEELEPGGTAICTVKLTNTALEDEVSNIRLKPTDLTDISIVDFKVNGGWGQSVSGNVYTVNPVGTTLNKNKYEFASFTIKLAESPKTDCGRICLAITYAQGSDSDATGLSGTYNADLGKNDPSCEDITIKKSTETGAFADYAVIIGAGLLAVAVLALANKKTKFYNV